MTRLNNMRVSAIILLLSSVLLAGCAIPSGTDDTSPPGLQLNPDRTPPNDDKYLRIWGLGLQKSSLSDNASYQEPTEQLYVLQHFINNTLQHLVQETCGSMRPYKEYISHYGDHYTSIIRKLIEDCGGVSSYPEQQKLVEEAISSGKEEYYYKKLESEAIKSLKDIDSTLRNFSGPSNEVEISVAAVVADRHWRAHFYVYESAPEMFELWKNGTQDGASELDRKLYLGNAFLALYDIPKSAHLMKEIISNYPFSTGECDHNDIDEMAAKAYEIMEKGMEKGRTYEIVSEFSGLSHMTGVMKYHKESVLPHHVRMGLWYGVLEILIKAAWFAEYYDYYEQERLPTVEESYQLILEFELNNRFTITDMLIMGVKRGVERGMESPEDYEYRDALKTLALPVLANPYRWVDCT